MTSGVEIYFVIHTVFFLCIFLDFLNVKKKVRNRVLVLLVIMVVLFGGLRWETGTDWDQYLYHFTHSDLSNIFAQERGGGRLLEPGFVLVNAIVKYLFGTFWMYNLITTGIIQFIRYKMCKLLCGEFALTGYCVMMILSSNYFSIRSGLGMGVALASFYFIKERHFKGFALTNVASYLIHVQGIVMFPFYWVGKIKLKWYVFIAILLSLCLFGYFFQAQFVSIASAFDGSNDAVTLASHYATQYETVSDGSRVRGMSTILMNFLFASIFLFVREKKRMGGDFWYNGLLNMFLVQTGIYVVFSDGMSDICRIGGLLIFAKFLLMLEYVLYFKEFGKKWQYFAILAFYGVYLISKIKSLDHGYYFYLCNVPYRTIFDFNLI